MTLEQHEQRLQRAVQSGLCSADEAEREFLLMAYVGNVTSPNHHGHGRKGRKGRRY